MATTGKAGTRVKRRGVLRRVVGWSLVGAGVVLAGFSVWMVWYRWIGYWGNGSVSVVGELRTGQLVLVVQQPGDEGRTSVVLRESSPWKVWEWVYDQTTMGRRVRTKGVVGVVTVWPFALVSVGGGTWALWADRRARRRLEAGACAGCGYSFAGLAVGAACPECGKAGVA